jgi:hypothetical protein
VILVKAEGIRKKAEGISKKAEGIRKKAQVRRQPSHAICSSRVKR